MMSEESYSDELRVASALNFNYLVDGVNGVNGSNGYRIVNNE